MIERTTDTGIVQSAGLHEDEMGRQVMRVVVDFYYGDAPDWQFSVIIKRQPVRIVVANT